MQFAELEAEAAQYQAIMARWRETGEVFTDPNFHPTKKLNEKASVSQALNTSGWERIDKKLKGKLFENIDEKAVRQGQLGDCYLIASLSAMAQYPENIKFLFHEDTDVASGAVIVYFYVRGQRFPVLIDTLFPFAYGGSSCTFARPRDVNDSYWFCLVEKAYAKLYGGYSQICGGKMHQVIYRIFGYSYFTLRMDGKIPAQAFFDKMVGWTSDGCIMGASINHLKGGITERIIEQSGLVAGHAYFVKCAEEHEGIRLVNLYNPWGDVEWQGDFGDASDLWRTRVRDAFRFESAEDGSFWMSCDDFYRFFTDFDVCVPVKRGWKCINALVETNGTNGSDEIEVTMKGPGHFRLVIEQCDRVFHSFNLNVRAGFLFLSNSFGTGFEIGSFSTKDWFENSPCDKWKVKIFPNEQGVDRMRMFLRFYVKNDATVTSQSNIQLQKSTGGTLPFGRRSIWSIGPPLRYRGDDSAERDRRQREEEEARRRQQEEAARRRQQEEEARRRQQEEEARRRQQEEEAARRRRQQEEVARRRQQEEEAARRRQQEEEAARRRRQQEEAARRRQQEEEAARRRQQEEAARRRQQEEEAARRRQQEEEARRRQQEEEARRRQPVPQPTPTDNSPEKPKRKRFVTPTTPC